MKCLRSSEERRMVEKKIESSRVKVKRESMESRKRGNRRREQGVEEEEKPQGRLSLFVFPLPSTG